VVVLRGPERALVVRRKSRVLGLWLNTAAETYDAVPGYFAIAATRPVADIAAPSVLARYQLGLDHLRLDPEVGAGAPDPEREVAFRAGLLRLKQGEGLYGAKASQVSFSGPNLFRAEFTIPSNVPLGNYKAEAYLFRDGILVAAQSSPLFVDKSGLERELFLVSRRDPALYGAVAIVVAVAAGWLAAVAFRRNA
jgi:uncharacterized protein (TIGR02186 family)